MRTTGRNLSILVNQITISYNDEGPEEAPVIIFIHGFPFTKSTWDSQATALKNAYRVISYDIRGHGSSDSGNTDFSMQLFASDLLCLMETLKLDKVILCGLSMGGYIALLAIENHPDRFIGLILSDTQCVADAPEARENRLKAINDIKANGVEKYAEESIKKLFAAESFATRKKEIAAVRKMIIETSAPSLCNSLLALSTRKETCSRLQEIKIPVLILVGEEDKITPLDAARFMHEKIQKSVLSIVAQAGHLANVENPDQFNAHLKDFLKQF
jgi:3-oxoadipate enol-lactonase